MQTIEDMRVRVFSADITKLPVDAIIVPINSTGMWVGEGGVNQRLWNLSDAFHTELAIALRSDEPPRHAFAVEAGKFYGVPFGHVIFVIDDIGLRPTKFKLSEVIASGLEEASRLHLGTVAVPMIRFGARSEVSGTESDRLAEVVVALLQHRSAYARNLTDVYLVVHGDDMLKLKLEQQLRSAKLI